MGKNILRHILYGLLKGHILNSINIYVYLLYIKYQYRNIPMQYISDTFMTDPALKYGRTLLLMSSLV